MDNRQKIVVGVVLTLIGCVATPLAFHYFGGKEPKVDLEALQEQFNTTLQTQLSEQKKQLEEEYNKKITEFESMTDEEKKQEQEAILNNRRITEKLREVILKYYESSVDRSVLVTSKDGNELITSLKFNTAGKKIPLKDNSSNISNIYAISHENSKSIDEGKLVEKNELLFKVITDTQEKFDISNSKMMLDYFNLLLGKDLSDDEKTAINIQANMNLSDLSSIKDLNMYIYNGDSLKIGDFIFKCVKGRDEETGFNYFEYTVTSHTVSEIKKEEPAEEKPTQEPVKEETTENQES